MSEASRPGFGRYKDLMEAHGFRPSRRFGQNFLLDPSLHRAIADAAELGAEHCVLEVGAGLGFLTRELAARCRHVVAVEVDPRLVAILREDVARWPHGERVAFVHADALERDEIAADVVAAVQREAGDEPVSLVANLPYAVSGRFLAAAFLATSIRLRRVVVVIQRELAVRLAASPGSRDFGGLSVLAQARGPVELVRTIGREVFRPRPNVDSAVVRIDCRRPAPAPGFGPFVRAMFAGRRKKLRHALGRLPVPVDDAAIARFGDRRAEQVTAAEFLELFASLEG